MTEIFVTKDGTEIVINDYENSELTDIGFCDGCCNTCYLQKAKSRKDKRVDDCKSWVIRNPEKAADFMGYDLKSSRFGVHHKPSKLGKWIRKSSPTGINFSACSECGMPETECVSHSLDSKGLCWKDKTNCRCWYCGIRIEPIKNYSKEE